MWLTSSSSWCTFTLNLPYHMSTKKITTIWLHCDCRKASHLQKRESGIPATKVIMFTSNWSTANEMVSRGAVYWTVRRLVYVVEFGSLGPEKNSLFFSPITNAGGPRYIFLHTPLQTNTQLQYPIFLSMRSTESLKGATTGSSASSDKHISSSTLFLFDCMFIVAFAVHTLVVDSTDTSSQSQHSVGNLMTIPACW
jgi:hypothetical protein